MIRRAYLLMIAAAVAVALLALTPVQTVQAVQVSSVSVTYGSTVCTQPQLPITVTVNGAFDADDGGVDSYAVKIYDARGVPMWPIAGISPALPPEQGGRTSARQRSVALGATTDTFSDYVYHATFNPVTIEVLDVVGGIVRGVVYSTTFTGPCESFQPPDDRLIDRLAGPVVVYTPGTDLAAVEVWRVTNQRDLINVTTGDLAIRVSFAQLTAIPARPSVNTAIASTSDGSVALYRLTSGECQVNANQAGTTVPYVLIFTCPTSANRITMATGPGGTTTSSTSNTMTMTNTTTTSGGTTYIVQTGDTLARIAQRFGTTVSALAAANNLSNPNLIYIGQILVLTSSTGTPGATLTPTPPPTGRTHVVLAGENLYRIGIRYGVTVEALMAANGITDPRRLYVGQVLVIPTGTTATPTPTP